MQNPSYENEFYLHVNDNLFSYERLCTKTCFEKEVQDNSQMPITCSTNGNFFFHIAESGHRCYFLQYEKFVSAEVNDSTCNIQ